MTIRNALATTVDVVARLNTVVEGTASDGGRIFKKRRALHAPLAIAAGEAFLRLSDARITMFARPSQWRAWEIHCARLLMERDDAAWSEGEWLCMRAVPGTSLRALAVEGKLAAAAIAAGARALKRAHTKHCSHFGAPWSHGDPHLGNVVVSRDDGSLIDFETRHTKGTPAQRHADDLTTYCFDLIGLGHDVTPALHAYAPSIDVRSALRDRLVARAGLPGVLVATRTHHLDAGELERRLARVRASLA